MVLITNIFLWNPQKVFFKVRDYICKRGLVLKCVVLTSNELCYHDSIIRLFGGIPECPLLLRRLPYGKSTLSLR